MKGIGQANPGKSSVPSGNSLHVSPTDPTVKTLISPQPSSPQTSIQNNAASFTHLPRTQDPLIVT